MANTNSSLENDEKRLSKQIRAYKAFSAGFVQKPPAGGDVLENISPLKISSQCRHHQDIVDPHCLPTDFKTPCKCKFYKTEDIKSVDLQEKMGNITFKVFKCILLKCNKGIHRVSNWPCIIE